MKKFLTFLLTAALLASASISVFADDVVGGAAPDAAQGEVSEESAPLLPQPLVLDGLTQVKVTSAMTNLDVGTTSFFDSIPETRCKIAFDVEDEAKTFSVYTATRIPEAISTFAVMLEGEQGTVVTLEVYGTNDSLLLDWTPILLTPESLDTEYAIFTLENTERYAFYRFDFTLDEVGYFDLAELALYKVTVEDEVELTYDIGDSVEVGEMPELVPVVKAEDSIAEEAEETPAAETTDDTVAAAAVEETEEETSGSGIKMSEIPTFGLFSSYPMPRFKFLPRG